MRGTTKHDVQKEYRFVHASMTSHEPSHKVFNGGGTAQVHRATMHQTQCAKEQMDSCEVSARATPNVTHRKKQQFVHASTTLPLAQAITQCHAMAGEIM